MKSTMCHSRPITTGILLALLQLPIHAAVKSTFYVSPTGNGDYSQASPGSLSGVQAKVRTVNTSISGEIVVYLKGGVYRLTTPMNFGPSDGGTGTNIVAYRNAPGEKPIISGGQQVTGWTVSSGTTWKASIPGVTHKIRNMFVNGVRANMARGPNAKGQGGWGTYDGKFDGIKFTPSSVGLYANPSLIELREVNNGGWAENTYCVREIASDAGFTVFKMQQPYFSICQYQFIYSIPQLVEGTTGWWEKNEGFDLYNAKEFLDVAGEFYFDAPASTLYYMPRVGENLATADVEVALVDGLVNVKGNNLSNRARNLQFWGITFEYSEWLLGNAAGYGMGTSQETSLIIGKSPCTSADDWDDISRYHQGSQSYLFVAPAAVNIESAENIDFEWNVIRHAGSVGLSLTNDVVNSTVIGNKIYDVGGSAINVGNPQDIYMRDSSASTYQVYGPTREGTCKNLVIKNNLCRYTGKQFRGHSGVAIYCTEAVDFSHNEIDTCTYSGLCIGWGWQQNAGSTTAKNNIFNNNLIHACMLELHDGATIYTLCNNFGTVINENWLYDEGQGIYFDEGSDGLSATHNVLTPEGEGAIWGNDAFNYTSTNNNTQDKSVKDSAGLQGCYSKITDETLAAPQPGENPCSATIIDRVSMPAKGVAKAKTVRMQMFDLRGRLLGKLPDVSADELRKTVRNKRLVSAGVVVFRPEIGAGVRKSGLVPLVR